MRLILVLILLNIASFGKQWYVSVEGNDNSDGSRGKPFLTISKAVSEAFGGDQIFIISGLYNVIDGIQFIRDSITVAGYNGNVIIDAKFSNLNNKFIDLRKHSYCVIKNLIIKNVSGWAVWIDGDYNTIDSCTILNSTKEGISIIGASYNRISNCAVINIGSNNTKANNISIEGKVDQDCNFIPANYNIVEYNKISQNKTHFGVNFLVSYQNFKSCKNDRSLIKGNIVRFNRIDSCWSGIYSRQHIGFEFYGNVIGFSAGPKNNYEGHGIKLDIKDDDFYIINSEGRIYNNTIQFCANNGIYNVNCTNLSLFNNLLYQNNLNNNNGYAYIKLNTTDGLQISNNAYFGDNIAFNIKNEVKDRSAWSAIENIFYAGNKSLSEAIEEISGKGLNLEKVDAYYKKNKLFSNGRWEIGALIH